MTYNFVSVGHVRLRNTDTTHEIAEYKGEMFNLERHVQSV